MPKFCNDLKVIVILSTLIIVMNLFARSDNYFNIANAQTLITYTEGFRNYEIGLDLKFPQDNILISQKDGNSSNIMSPSTSATKNLDIDTNVKNLSSLASTPSSNSTVKIIPAPRVPNPETFAKAKEEANKMHSTNTTEVPTDIRKIVPNETASNISNNDFTTK
jgi:hypothetical protein